MAQPAPDTPDTSRQPASCDRHPSMAAIAICSTCHKPLCHHCHASDLRGFCVCLTCRESKEQEPGTPWDDEQSSSATSAFSETLYNALRSPSTFWDPISARAKARPAVLFGLLCIALGITMQTVWQFALDPEYEERMREAMAFAPPGNTLKVLALARVAIIAPIIFFLHTSILNSAIKLAGGKTRYALTARIVGYACAAYALRFIPPIFGLPIGQMLMIMWLYNIELAGVMRYCQLERMRAMVVVLGAIIGSILLGLL